MLQSKMFNEQNAMAGQLELAQAQVLKEQLNFLNQSLRTQDAVDMAIQAIQAQADAIEKASSEKMNQGSQAAIEVSRLETGLQAALKDVLKSHANTIEAKSSEKYENSFSPIRQQAWISKAKRNSLFANKAEDTATTLSTGAEASNNGPKNSR